MGQGMWTGVLQIGRVAIAAGLCGLMAEQPLVGEAAFAATRRPVRWAQIQGRERVLHALNRLTFGPRPGDVAAVEALGLNAWFERQLHPNAIDDSQLDARLSQYPAMNLSIAELEARYPAPQTIRQIIAGQASMPNDPGERAMVEDQIALYKMEKAKREAKASPDDSEQASQPDSDLSRENVLKIVALPPDRRFDAVMAMSPAELVRFRQALKPSEKAQLLAGLAPAQRETLEALGGSLKMVGLEEMEARLDRDLYSNRQLEAVMTDFWLNHFNVYVKKNQEEAFLIPLYERDTIRANALGNFETLLVATAMSPAMLEYLDNARSIGPDSAAAERVKRREEMQLNGPASKGASAGLNENYGRELMELHTLGVNGGYTQADVTNVAKVFTGWTIDKNTKAFVFDERRHEPGSKTVLGQTIQEGGMKEGLEVLHMLAASPATAHFISRKLAVRFVGDTPPEALVDRMAATFLSSHGDMRQVLLTMWKSPEFWSPGVYRAKVKTPEEFLVSAVRASGAEVENPAALVAALGKLGMPLYGMQTPNGYGWKSEDWVSTGALVSRMNFALVLSAGRIPGTKTSWAKLLSEPVGGVVRADYSPGGGPDRDGASVAAAKELRLETVLLGESVSDRTRATVVGQADDASVTEQAETQFDLRGGGKGAKTLRPKKLGTAASGSPDDAQAAVMAGLLLGSPEFQRR